MNVSMLDSLIVDGPTPCRSLRVFHCADGGEDVLGQAVGVSSVDGDDGVAGAGEGEDLGFVGVGGSNDEGAEAFVADEVGEEASFKVFANGADDERDLMTFQFEAERFDELDQFIEVARRLQ